MPKSIVNFQMHLINDLEYFDVILDNCSMYIQKFANLFDIEPESIHQKNLEYIPTLPSTYVLSMFACQCTAANHLLGP